jgi:hypothetical protein
VAQYLWQDFRMSSVSLWLTPVAGICRYYAKQKQSAEKHRQATKDRCVSLTKKMKVLFRTSQNRDKHMHFSVVLRNNCEHNSNVTSNYLLLALGEANVLLIASRALFVTNHQSLRGQGRLS